MTRPSLLKLGAGLVVVGLICIAFARQAYSHAESVEMFSATLQGASMPAAEAAGAMAGMQAAILPGGLAVISILAGVALLIAAAVRKS